MRRVASFVGSLLLIGAGAACSSGSHSAAGFRLPSDGDPERGKEAFVALGCHNCHDVPGVELPRRAAQNSIPVVLERGLNDGCLVTSIICPAARLAPYRPAAAAAKSAMPCLVNELTVRQLTDIVTFLQAYDRLHNLPARNSPPKDTSYWSFRLGLHK